MLTDMYINLCAMITVIMLIISLYIRKQTQGRSNMLFIMLCVAILTYSASSCLNVIFEQIVTIDSVTLPYFYLVIYIYNIFHQLIPLLYVLYLFSQIGIWHIIVHNRYVHALITFPVCFALSLLLSNPMTKAIFYIDDNGHSVFGEYYIICLSISLFYFMFGIILLIRYRAQVNRSKFCLLMSFLPINIAITIGGYLTGNLHNENLTNVFLLLIITLGVQRPEDYIDPIVGVMSKNAFLDDIRQVYNLSSPISVLFINFTNHATLRNNLGVFTYYNLLKRLADKTTQIGKIMSISPDIYYLDNGTFAIKTSRKQEEKLLDLGRMLHAYMQEPVKLSHMEVMVDTMVCLVNCPDDINDQEAFINFSRNFHQKLARQNRVIVLSQIATTKDFSLRSRIDHIINKGIANRRFKMYYQPIYSLKQKRFVSAEALIRLEDDEFGFIPPSIFIPAAEESGAIHQIGNFVFEDVCRFIASEEYRELDLEYIELNLSVAQCIERDFSQKVISWMNQYGVSPSQLNLEITETAVDYDPTTTDISIRQLADIGISFSLDDYGTGYSNIKRVVSLPLSIVKLDKCLVDDMDSHRMWIVIKNTVRMLQRMNKKILVEGVETERALHKFDEIGCDYVQGYYFSKPLPENQFIEFIRKNNQIQ